MMSGLTAMFISNLLPYFALVWSLAYLLIFDKMFQNRDGARHISHLIVPLATLGFVGFFVLMPIRTIINKCFSEANLNLTDAKTYSQAYE